MAVVQNRLVKVPPLEGPVRHIVHQTFWHKASVSIRKAFRQVTQGTLWLANSQIASSMIVEAQLMAVVQNRFGIYPLVEGPARHVHPKTTTFCLVLGFTPSGRPSRAHQSQNDLGQLYSGTSVAFPDGLCGTFRPVFPSRFFRTCNVRKKIGLSRTFSSGRVTSGNCQSAFQAPLWHILVFRTCNVGKKIGLSRTFSFGRVTLGTA